MANASDNFDRSNGAIGGTLASDGVHTWTAHSGAWAITSNRLTAAATGGQRLSIDCGASDVDVIATLKATNGANPQAIMIRHADSNNYMLLQMTSSAMQLRRRVGGSETFVTSGPTPAINSIYRVNCVGNTINVYEDDGGGEVLIIGPETVTGLSSNTQHGFYANFSNGDWDDFSVVDLSSSGVSPLLFTNNAYFGALRHAS